MRKVCKCKRAYENPLSEICSLCWNELYPNEKDEIKDEDLLEPKQEQEVCNRCGKTLREQMKGCGEITCYRQFLPKQETLEEVAEEFYSEQSKSYEDDIEPMFDTSRYLVAGFIEGAKWQQERSYSEEDIREAFENGVGSGKYQAEYGDNAKGSMNFEYFIRQFKKK